MELVSIQLTEQLIKAVWPESLCEGKPYRGDLALDKVLFLNDLLFNKLINCMF